MSSNESFRCVESNVNEQVHWLKTIYQEENIPLYEINKKTLAILQHIMDYVERRRKYSKIIAENINNKILIYDKETLRLSKILHQSKVVIPAKIQSSVTSLAYAAAVLSLKDTTDTSFLHEIENVLQDILKTTTFHEEESKTSDKLSAETIAMQQKVQQLQRELKSAEAWSNEQLSELNNNKKLSSFLKSKGKEYEQEISLLEEQLCKIHVSSNVCHETLVSKDEVVKQMKEKLNLVQLKLQSFDCLPANEDLARIKIAEAEMELEKLEKEFALKVESVIPNAI